MFYVKVVYVRSIENHKIYLTNVVYSIYSAKEGGFFVLKIELNLILLYARSFGYHYFSIFNILS